MATNDGASTQVVDPQKDLSEKDTVSGAVAPLHNPADQAIGAGLGLVGGAIVGGVAGGPLGAAIGAIVGALASDAAVVGVEHAETVNSSGAAPSGGFDNSGSSTSEYDAATGVTHGDRTIGDVSATDHTIFGSSGGEMVDDSVPIGTRSSESHD